MQKVYIISAILLVAAFILAGCAPDAPQGALDFARSMCDEVRGGTCEFVSYGRTTHELPFDGDDEFITNRWCIHLNIINNGQEQDMTVPVVQFVSGDFAPDAFDPFGTQFNTDCSVYN